MNCDESMYISDNLKERLNAHKLQLDILHQYKVMQIDENRKISRRVDELEKDIEILQFETISRIEKLEKKQQIEHKVERIAELEKKIKELEDFHIKFKDVMKEDLKTNDKIFRDFYNRIEKIENMPKFDLKECIDLVNEHEKYLKNIDKIALCDPDKIAHNQKVLNEKFDRLEQLFYDEKEKFRNPPKAVYKCPVCYGDGIYREDGKIYNGRSCNACEGKGVLWS